MKAPLLLAAAALLAGSSVSAGSSSGGLQAPGSRFDLGYWKITLPEDGNKDGKIDEVDVGKIQKYVHPDFFFLDADGRMVFVAPNKAATTANSSNTRSELRHMLRGANTRIKTADPGNNFAVEARKDSDKFGAVGGKLEATLRVDHVARNAANPKSAPAYAVVIGQIHALSYDDTKSGFGYGNEPLKIFYKKHPGHETGSVFWTYERNLPKDNPDRKDIAYPVWGNLWTNHDDPGGRGIALGEDFSYTVNVHRNTMYLTFENARLGTVRHRISLVDNVGATGVADPLDNKYSYGGDSIYFKAGVYNQCSTKSSQDFWAPGCAGTGDWPVDQANGDYAQASFSRLVVGPSSPE